MLACQREFGARHVPLPSGTLANRPPAELLCRKAPFVLAGAFSWACAFAIPLTASILARQAGAAADVDVKQP